MADNEILVKIAAEISGFTAGMRQAKDQLESFAAQVQSITTALSNIGTVTLAALGLDKLVDEINGLAESASKFDIRMAGLQATLGIGAQEAQALGGALQILGSSTDQYVALSQRLERQLRTNESEITAMGVATRNANGQFLPTTQIVQNAIQRLAQFADGSDRAQAAIRIFGGRVGDIAPILRLTNQQIEEARAIFASFNALVTNESIAAAKEYEDATGKLSLAFQAMKERMGRELQPSLTDLVNFIRDHAVAIFDVFNKVLLATVAGFNLVAYAIEQSIAEVTFLYRALGDLATFDFSKIGEDWAKLTKESADNTDALTRRLYLLQQEWKNVATGTKPEPKTGDSFNDPAVAAARAKAAAQAELEEWKATYAQEIAVEKQKYDLGQESAQDYYRVLRTLANQDFDNTKAILEKERAQVTGSEAQKAAEIEKINGQIEVARIKLATRVAAIGFQQTQDEVRQAQQAANEEIAAIGRATEAKIRAAEQALATQSITAQQAAQIEIAAVNQQEQAETQLLQHLIENGNLTIAEQRKLWAQIEQIEQTSAQKRADIEAKAAKQIQREWETTFNSILQPFNQAIDGMIRGTQTLQQAIGNILESLLMKFIEFVEEEVVKWAAGELTKLGISTSSAAAQLGKMVTAGFAQIQVDAAVAAAGTEAATAYLGPEVSVPAAAAAYKETLGWAAGLGGVGLAVGAWDIPGTMAATLHAGEMVVPQTFAEGIRQNAGGFGGGDVHVHAPINITAFDARSVTAWFKRYPNLIGDQISRAIDMSSNSLRGSAIRLGAGR